MTASPLYKNNSPLSRGRGSGPSPLQLAKGRAAKPPIYAVAVGPIFRPSYLSCIDRFLLSVVFNA